MTNQFYRRQPDSFLYLKKQNIRIRKDLFSDEEVDAQGIYSTDPRSPNQSGKHGIVPKLPSQIV